MDPAGGGLRAFAPTARRFAAFRYALRCDCCRTAQRRLVSSLCPPCASASGRVGFLWRRTVPLQHPGEALCRGRSPLEDVGERWGFSRGRENRNSLPLECVFSPFLRKQKGSRRRQLFYTDSVEPAFSICRIGARVSSEMVFTINTL